MNFFTVQSAAHCLLPDILQNGEGDTMNKRRIKKTIKKVLKRTFTVRGFFRFEILKRKRKFYKNAYRDFYECMKENCGWNNKTYSKSIRK